MDHLPAGWGVLEAAEQRVRDALDAWDRSHQMDAARDLAREARELLAQLAEERRFKASDPGRVRG